MARKPLKLKISGQDYDMHFSAGQETWVLDRLRDLAEEGHISWFDTARLGLQVACNVAEDCYKSLCPADKSSSSRQPDNR